MARIHRKLYRKDLHDPHIHDDVITHLEPDILECEVKWALGSINTKVVVVHKVKGLSVVNQAEIDAFLEFSCF